MSIPLSRVHLRVCSLLLWLCVGHVVAAQFTLSHSHARRQYDGVEVHVDEDVESEAHREKFFKFHSRPDIDAPKWDVQIYDKDALSPGYWFMASYSYVKQKASDSRAWVGPWIYDSNGELVWSGAQMFGGFNVKDFKVSNVNGVDMLSGIYTHKHVDVLLNDKYEIHKEVAVGSGRSSINIHGFNTVDNGTHALAMTLRHAWASSQESKGVGFDGQCRVLFPGFEEYNTTTWEQTYEWNAEGHIRLDEVFVEANCTRWWDYL